MEAVSAGKPRPGRVIGVVKDFHLRSLHHAVEPLALLIAPAPYYLDNMVIRLEGQNVPQALSALEHKWRDIAPHRPFDYFFLEPAFDALYRKEHRVAQIFEYFAALAIFIGGLGLFGLASFMAEQKTKEYGIRKELGATGAAMVALLVGMGFPVRSDSMYFWMKNTARA